MAAKLVLEPIFEADFCPTSYGFRPGRRAQDAIEETRLFINPPGGYEWVIEGDVENCFGQIHHGLLMEQVRRRVTDKRVLALIRRFLGAGVMTELGTMTATPSGTPQGAILSPVLANIALSVLDRHFEAAWQAHGPAPRRVRQRAKGHATYRHVRYADDFLVLVAGTRAQAEAIKQQTTEFMAEQMRLTLSPEKTHITHIDEGFDFLGWRVKRYHRPSRAPVAITFPSDRALADIKHRIKKLTGKATTGLSLDQLIHALNPVLRGWTNYHRHGSAKRCFGYLSYYLWWRVVRWLRKKTDQAAVLGTQLDKQRGHQAPLAGRGAGDPLPIPRTPDPDAVEPRPSRPTRLQGDHQSLMASRATSACPVESRMLGNGHVRFGGRRRADHRA